MPGHIGEWIVAGRSAVGIQSDDHAGEMSVVGRGTAKLIVGLPWIKWASRQILQLAAASVVTNLNVQLAIGSKKNLAGVVIASQRLAGINWVSVVLLVGTHFDQIPVEDQRVVTRIEDETVNAISQRLGRSRRKWRVWVTDFIQVTRDCARAALRPVEIDQLVACES